MLGLGFVKSLIFFQEICRNFDRSFENAEKKFREKKEQPARARALAQEKYIRSKSFQN